MLGPKFPVKIVDGRHDLYAIEPTMRWNVSVRPTRSRDAIEFFLSVEPGKIVTF